MAAVLGVVDTHATNRNILIQGTLALGNIGRAGEGWRVGVEGEGVGWRVRGWGGG